MTCVHPNGRTLIDWDFEDRRRMPSDSATEQVVINGQVVTRLKQNVIQELQCMDCGAKEVVRP